MTRSIFYGYGAWVGTQNGLTTCSWWPDDPAGAAINWSTAKLITSDLAKNPQAVRNGQIAATAVEVDDPPANGGLTKIGPTWPTGSTINGCWIESTKHAALNATQKPARPPSYMQCRAYELTTVYYWSGAMANRRFYGFYAEITSEQGQNALCSVWPAGKSLVANQQPAGSWWINLSTAAHPIEAGFTEIGLGLNKPKQGAVFLDLPTIANLQLASPKLPPATGIDLFPR